MRKRAEAEGYTLVEVMIASIFLVLVVGATYGVLLAGSSAQSTSSNLAYIQDVGRIVIGRVNAELRDALILHTSSTSTTLRFMLPVDHDGDGDVTDVNGDIEWGIVEAGVPTLNNYAEYRFAPTATLDENAVKKDLNQDGDKNDLFQKGNLVRVTQNGNPSTPLTGYAVRHSTDGEMNVNFDSDRDGLNNDAGEDNLFTWTTDASALPLRVVVNLWTYGKDSKGRHLFAHNRSGVYLRNPQN